MINQNIVYFEERCIGEKRLQFITYLNCHRLLARPAFENVSLF